MSKKIILLSDGTGNSSAKLHRTNVWRIFQAIDQSDSDQIAMYDDGVGTARARILAILGGAFGWGLKSNILDLYKFVCRNYEAGDEIYAFGFSRGAFTIRTLIGFICHAGVIGYHSQEELDKHAKQAYRNYRRSCFKPTQHGAHFLSPVTWMQGIAKLFEKPITPHVTAADVKIRFLGLWDTVGAYGMPLKELKPAVSFIFWPIYWKNRRLPYQVDKACHALSLDDQRTTFHPILWEEDALQDQQRIEQVWFSGVHANLGGGYPEDRLSFVSLNWIRAKAVSAGLRLLPDAEDTQITQSPFGRLYDSRKGVQMLYRYAPRKVCAAANAGAGSSPVIHHSVIARLARGTDEYAPHALEFTFKVLAPSGQHICYKNGEVIDPLDSYQLKDRSVYLDLEKIQQPNESARELALDAVWWRRMFYFLAMAAIIFLAGLPIFGKRLHDIFQSAENDQPIVSQAIKFLVNSFADLAEPIMPALTNWWFESVRSYSYAFAFVTYQLFFFLYFGRRQKKRLRDLTRASWLPSSRLDYLGWLKDYARQSIRNFSIFAAIFLVTGLLILYYVWPNYKADIWLLVFILVNFCLFVLGVANYRSIEKKLRQYPGLVQPTMTLQVARIFRTNSAIGKCYRHWSFIWVPGCLGITLLFLLLAVLNHAALTSRALIGIDCMSTPNRASKFPATATIAAEAYCGGSQINLTEGHTYKLRLQVIDRPLTNRQMPTTLAGYEGVGRNIPEAFFRRHWTQNYFIPVARIGRYGSEEYILRPKIPYPPSRNAPDPAIGWTLTTTLMPKQSGELFIYLNDSASALRRPGSPDKEHAGTINVQVDEVTE